MFQGGVFEEIVFVCKDDRLLMDIFGQTIYSRKSRYHYLWNL